MAEANRAQRARLASAIASLGNHGLAAIPSKANFVLMTCPEQGPLNAAAINRALAARGILVRWLPGQGLPHALRISVGTEAETGRVIEALKDICAQSA
jgi:histidinol-phosphate aminotransferase